MTALSNLLPLLKDAYQTFYNRTRTKRALKNKLFQEILHNRKFIFELLNKEKEPTKKQVQIVIKALKKKVMEEVLENEYSAGKYDNIKVKRETLKGLKAGEYIDYDIVMIFQEIINEISFTKAFINDPDTDQLEHLKRIGVLYAILNVFLKQHPESLKTFF